MLVDKSTERGRSRLGFQWGPLAAVLLWACYLTSLRLIYLICITAIIIMTIFLSKDDPEYLDT